METLFVEIEESEGKKQYCKNYIQTFKKQMSDYFLTTSSRRSKLREKGLHNWRL